MKTLEKNLIKVLETEKLLRKVITTPADFMDDEELLKALKSQSAISKYQNQEYTIVSCSLNTFKSISDTLFERGFLSLDELRISAKSAIKMERNGKEISKGNKQTFEGLKKKVTELEVQLDAIQRSNFSLTVIVTELRSKLKQLAEHDGKVEERKELYREHNKKIQAEMNYTLNGNAE